MDVGCHDTALGRTEVSIEIQTVALGIERLILEVHVVGHLDKHGILLPQVSHIEIVARTGTRLDEIHQRLVVVHIYAVETHWFGRVLIEQHILALRRTDLVIVDLHTSIHIRELLALRRSVIGTIVEAIAQP